MAIEVRRAVIRLDVSTQGIERALHAGAAVFTG